MAEAIPGTPGIREVRIGSGSENFNPARRPEIAIFPPLESNQDAVTRSSACKIGGNYDGVGEFCIKRMEENAAKLEKDLIMKELETLDFLEALGSTKKIVEELKRELQQQALRCMESPKHLRSHVKKINDEQCHHNPLKQARLDLGKTMNDIAMIQSSAESLNMKTEEEKDFLGVPSLAEELNSLRLKPPGPDQGERFNTENPQSEEVKMVVETNDAAFHKQSKTCLRTAEMRLLAARKMEEAARAAEALAIAEMTILATEKAQYGLCFPEPPRSTLTLKAQMNKDLSTELLRKLEEANEEVKQSKRALETALNQVEIASVKQLEAEDAFRQLNIESWKEQKAIRAKRSMKRDDFPQHAFFNNANQQHEPLIDLPKPMLKRNVSMRNVLNWKKAPSFDERQLVTPRRKFRFIHNQAST